MRMVASNEDKPHRCPECHRIPDAARADGAALQGKTYSCSDCQVEWVTPSLNEAEWRKGTACAVEGAISVSRVRKALDGILREADVGHEEHPWRQSLDTSYGGTSCNAHNECFDCCLDPDHKDYDKLLDYLSERVARALWHP